MLRRLFIALAFIGVPAPLMAAEAAAGRIERPSGGTGCTAVLIASDLVATAAHCGQVNSASGAQHYFRIGAHNGLRGARYKIAAGATHPLYRMWGSGDARRFRFDLAILSLEENVPPTVATPIPVGPRAYPGEVLTLASWRDRSEPRARERQCPVLDGYAGVLTIGCRVQGGESGSPIIRYGDEGPELVAILAGTTQLDQRPVGLGVHLEGRMAPTLDALRADERKP